MARKTATTRSKSQNHRATRRTKSATSRRRTSANTTTDHGEIRRWAETGGGVPACVKGTGSSEDVGMIRIEFPGAPNARDEKLQPIDWDEFFDKFDEHKLALLYQDRTAGGQRSNFYKLVSRDTARRGRNASARSGSSSGRRSRSRT